MAVLKGLKARVRAPYRDLRKRYVQWRYGFGDAELRGALASIGIVHGDAVLVHSAITGFDGFHGTIHDILSVIQDAVGPDGTVMMPTLSMTGSAIEFAESGKTFDVRTTPSRMGLLTEVFRRSAGVVRSVHPTHSVAVRSPESAWWTADHHLADTPCGRGSPYHRLLERNGKVILAGVGISSMTFYHSIEEIIEGRLPTSPFTSARYRVSCRSEGGTFETCPMRLYAPELSARRRLGALQKELVERGAWHEIRVGTLSLVAVAAVDALRAVETMADRGTYCYDLE